MSLPAHPFADDAAPPDVPLTPQQRARHLRLGALLAVTSLLILFVGLRLSQRGEWLPAPPDNVGNWTATDITLAQSLLEMLGNPPARAHRYANLFDERVDMHYVATASFEAYQDPPQLNSGYGYAVTAEKRFFLFGPGKPLRAVILKSDQTGQRVLLYYWVQYKNGETSAEGNLRDPRNLLPRVLVGAKAVVMGQQSCIVRAWTGIHPSDEKGIQARRNLNEICQTLYSDMKKEGAK